MRRSRSRVEVVRSRNGIDKLTVLHCSNNVVAGCRDLVVKVSANLEMAARDVTMGSHVAVRDGPALAPVGELVEDDGFAVSVWPYCKPGTPPDDADHNAASALAALHVAMAEPPVALPALIERFTAVASCSRTPPPPARWGTGIGRCSRLRSSRSSPTRSARLCCTRSPTTATGSFATDRRSTSTSKRPASVRSNGTWHTFQTMSRCRSGLTTTFASGQRSNSGSQPALRWPAGATSPRGRGMSRCGGTPIITSLASDSEWHSRRSSRRVCQGHVEVPTAATP